MTGAHRILKSSGAKSVLADPGGRTEDDYGYEKPLSRMVLVFLSPPHRKRDLGAAVANGDRM